ncbi:MAG: hypothetical protein K6A43_05685 [Treponema sp.]|nr:hypothetical protein [Treponema sp.]
MKALIISDEENFIKKMDSFFQSHGADTIIYKWLLKALDNIEEIRPDVIVLSSSEYPRHWKTLVQFVKSGIGGDKVDIFLYEPNPVSDEDKEKIKLLGITGVFESLDKESLKVICPIFGEFISRVGGATETEDVTVACDTLIFTHPLSMAFVTGKVDSKDDNFIHFTADFDEQTKELKQGMNSFATFYCGDYCTTVPVQINSIEKENIYLEVKV